MTPASPVPRLFLLGLVLALCGLIVVVRQARTAPEPPGELKSVTEFRDQRPLPAFHLSGPHGDFTHADLLGRWSFLFFGYTQCPDICPTALARMKVLKTQLAAEPSVPTPQVLFVTVDSARDSRELLDQYTAAFDPAFIGLRGDDEALRPLLADLGAFFQRNDATDKLHYTVDHSATIYLVDPLGRLAATFSPPQSESAMAADFQRLVTSR